MAGVREWRGRSAGEARVTGELGEHELHVSAVLKRGKTGSVDAHGGGEKEERVLGLGGRLTSPESMKSAVDVKNSGEQICRPGGVMEWAFGGQ